MYRPFVAAAFVAAIVPIAASAETFPSRLESGSILAVDHRAITMDRHRTVFLKHGTRIEPRGERLEPGQRIVVQGDDTPDGKIDARAIRILGKTYATARGYGSWYGGRDDQVPTGGHAVPQVHPHDAVVYSHDGRATARHATLK
ncbi:MAG: hypothetical protein NVS2B8_15960 [Vulcanimicrobiaceae bacterium]